MRSNLPTAFLGLLTGAPVINGLYPQDSGTFSNPASRVRPRFRYWLPDAGVDADAVIKDVISAASIGSGGMEFLPFYEYGGDINPMPLGANWAKHNFGTPEFNTLFEKVLEAHEERGLVMDFALGPNQGQGVPAHPDNEGLQWDMVPFTAEVSSSGSFNGIVPGWGTGNLVSMVTALVKSNKTITFEGSGLAGPQNVTYDDFKLGHRTLSEVTQRVDRQGRTRLSFPKAPQGSHYRIFTFYERLSKHKNLKFTSKKHEAIFDNGSYAVDHFSGKGATVVGQFWDEHILKGNIPKLLARVGNYAWEDSMELTYNVSWSKSIPVRFQKVAGYSIKPYLPLLTFKQNTLGVQGAAPGPYRCTLDTEDEGIGYINDFRATLIDGYNEYLTTMADWVHKKLHTQLSIQTASGSSLDVLAAVPQVDAPECESLGYEDNIDSYRAFSGPARLTGKRVVSNEMGAVRNAGLQYHLPHLVFQVNRAFMGGVNQMVLHGQSYSGPYYGTTWPGHVPFNYLFAEPFSPRLPSWNNGLKGTMDYIARNQHVLQNGTPKVDVVIYNKQSASTIRRIYQGDDLLARGWSWNYLSADNLNDKHATVRDGILTPDGPAWKALIVENTQNLTLGSIESLGSFAKKGLPIIFTGGAPAYFVRGDGAGRKKFKTQLSRLLKARNVYTVGPGKVADKLKSLGLLPQIQTSANGTLYTSWTETSKVGYAFLYADMVRSTGSVTIRAKQSPFYFNAWTGEITPVLIYKQDKGFVTIPVNLAGNQTLLLAFGDNLTRSPLPKYHVNTAPSNVLDAQSVKGRGISLQVSRSLTSSKAVLSNGKHVIIDGRNIPGSFQLSKWNLTAEHWEAPQDLESLDTAKRNTTHELKTPTSWTEIPALANASGVGYYTTSIQWPPKGAPSGSKSLGAYIQFSRVVDVIQVTINGKRLPPLDVTNAVADIGPYLKEGKNVISLTVPTTFWNYLRTIITELESSGSQPLPLTLQSFGMPLVVATEEGLVGTVTIKPYQTLVC
ncbi:hypothetical protein FOQG_14856 [Fusarium oxysporum f. sp. raphani 54005]|uniref:Secreted protein n=2 Tax=Fusarium oxysporum f. sp. raphani TaxID=96318 RepID=X0BES5_FUSOX|nr:hypothetical protein FOQG_14856 [Fusarium oxysporum f. sp. raphani 54005]KAG7437197.1 hypothetical protein Forpi1262_v001981 [Fusarium oxysporum f. sp. raphani]